MKANTLPALEPRVAFAVFGVSYHMPHPDPLIRHYPLSVRSEVEAVDEHDARSIILARHADRVGREPKVIAVVRQ